MVPSAALVAGGVVGGALKCYLGPFNAEAKAVMGLGAGVGVVSFPGHGEHDFAIEDARG